MTKDQVLAAVRKYDGWLKDFVAERIDLTIRAPTKEQAMGHLRWMFAELSDGLAGVPGKSDRWIGFVQGALWLAGYGSIEEFKDDNR